MKITLQLLIILISFASLGQKWHLNKIDEKSDYPYEYWFSFQHLEDSNSYVVQKISGEKSLIQVSPNKPNERFSAYIRINNLAEANSVQTFDSFEKLYSIALEPGEYSLTIDATNYEPFELEFKLDPNEQLDLKLAMGLDSEVEVYQIDSKKELSKEKIGEIIKCASESENFFGCSQKGQYRVMMHL